MLLWIIVLNIILQGVRKNHKDLEKNVECHTKFFVSLVRNAEFVQARSECGRVTK